MVHHTCRACQQGFIATSCEEAIEVYREAKEFKAKAHIPMGNFNDLVNHNELHYAKCCPYCDSDLIEAV